MTWTCLYTDCFFFPIMQHIWRPNIPDAFLLFLTPKYKSKDEILSYLLRKIKLSFQRNWSVFLTLAVKKTYVLQLFNVKLSEPFSPQLFLFPDVHRQGLYLPSNGICISSYHQPLPPSLSVNLLSRFSCSLHFWTCRVLASTVTVAFFTRLSIPAHFLVIQNPNTRVN